MAGIDVDSCSACGPDEFYEAGGGETATFYDAETGFVETHVHDEDAVKVLLSGDFSAWESLVKTMLVIRHNESKTHKLNDDIRKGVLKVLVSNIVSTYNGRAYLACQVIAGGINIGMAFLAASPQTAKNLGGRFFTMNQWDLTDAKAAREFSRFISKSANQISQPATIAGQICDNSANSVRVKDQGEQPILNNQDQNAGQEKSTSTNAEKELLQQLANRTRQDHETFSSMAAPAA